MNYTVLFNPLAGNGNGLNEAEKLREILKDDKLEFVDMCKISDYGAVFASAERIVIAGGDGTLNRFINDTRDIEAMPDIYYFACGSGNDFARDIASVGQAQERPVKINEYIKCLPEVSVKGKTYKFLNNVGFGIDGFCCEVGDKLRKIPDKKVNYASIAIKGLLYAYHPTNARITVDGREYSYKKVWLAPTMNGRYYGGGMNAAPAQDRQNKGKTVSLVVMYGSDKLKTLMVFPSIFKGEHVSHTEMVAVHTGHNITVTFDRPTALQIDGETILGVTEYTVRTCNG